jgi:SAM-dependent methyltransferase
MKETTLLSSHDATAHSPRSAARLNLGCGNDYREGYVNVDMHASHRVDLVSDVASLRMIADLSCSEVLAQDVLEHIQRLRAGTALREWNRVLAPGGCLTLRVPSLIHLLELMKAPSRQTAEAQRLLIQCLYGTQGYEGDFHFNGFTEITLRDELADAGFEVKESTIVDEWMFQVDARKVSHVPPDSLLLIDSDEEFVTQAYSKLLGREADRGGLDYYVAVIERGCAREAVLESLKGSVEYQSRLASRI